MLHFAVKKNNDSQIVNLLISSGVNINAKTKKGTTPLHYAVIRKNKAYDFTKELLNSRNIIIDIKDNYGATPLMWAASYRADSKVIDLLLKYGANVNLRDNQYKAHSLLAAAMPTTDRKNKFINPETIQLLLEHKADTTFKDIYGRTALNWMEENQQFKQTPLFQKLKNK